MLIKRRLDVYRILNQLAHVTELLKIGQKRKMNSSKPPAKLRQILRSKQKKQVKNQFNTKQNLMMT